MSADLERVYAKLAERADREKIPSFSGVLARARQRRRRHLSTALAAVAVLALFTSTAFLLTRGAAPEPGGRVFVTFDGSAGQVISHPSTMRSTRTITDQGRSYVTWEDHDDQVWVAVIDLATGKTPWAPVSLGKLDGALLLDATHDVILLLVDQGPDTIVAMDPLTGKVMWTQPYQLGSLAMYTDTLVISTNLAGTPEALDLRTGHPKWTVPDSLTGGGLLAVRDLREFESYSGGRWLPATDRRVVFRFADGRVQIRDINTGEVLSERSGVQAPPDIRQETVIGDNLYWLDPQGLVRTSLTGSDAPQRLYLSTHVDRSTMFGPCGPTLICLSSLDELIAIDDQGQQAWHKPRSQGGPTYVSGAHIVSQERANTSAVYDLNGTQVLPPEYQDGAAQWIDADHLLIFRPDGVTVYSLTTREGQVLGQILWANGCSWNTTKLVCPTPTGVSVWTYALS